MKDPMTKPQKFVYAMWAVGTTRFKIGFSGKVESRRETLEEGCPNPLVVVATKPGTMTDEYALHRLLKKRGAHSHREWFSLTEEDVYVMLGEFGISRDYVYGAVHLV